ncbi:MAG: sigma-70 family RNA polymerase sigma factor [Candidatus Nitrosomaritimum yanchengensis]
MQTNHSIQQLEPQNWVHKYKGYLFNFAYKKLPHDMVEDIVQDTFLAALNSAHRFKGASSERVWLTAILKYKIADHYRGNNNKRYHIRENIESRLSSDRKMEYNYEFTYDPIPESINENDLKSVLNSGMSNLSKREHQVLELKKKGFKTDAICEELQISQSLCWVSLHRARKKLQQYLNENWWNGN